MAFEVRFIQNTAPLAFVQGLDLPGIAKFLIDEARFQRKLDLQSQKNAGDPLTQTTKALNFLKQVNAMEASGDDQESATINAGIIGNITTLYGQSSSKADLRMTQAEVKERLDDLLKRGIIDDSTRTKMLAVSKSSFADKDGAIDDFLQGLDVLSDKSKSRIKSAEGTVDNLVGQTLNKFRGDNLKNAVDVFSADPDAADMGILTKEQRDNVLKAIANRKDKTKGKQFASDREKRAALLLALQRRGMAPKRFARELDKLLGADKTNINVILGNLGGLSKSLAIFQPQKGERFDVDEDLVNIMDALISRETLTETLPDGTVVPRTVIEGDEEFTSTLGNAQDIIQKGRKALEENLEERTKLFKETVKFADDKQFDFFEKNQAAIMTSKTLDLAGNALVQGRTVSNLKTILDQGWEIYKRLPDNSPEKKMLEIRLTNVIDLSGISSRTQLARQRAGLSFGGIVQVGGTQPDREKAKAKNIQELTKAK